MGSLADWGVDLGCCGGGQMASKEAQETRKAAFLDAALRGEAADVVLCCGEVEWWVHKWVLRKYSPALKVALDALDAETGIHSRSC